VIYTADSALSNLKIIPLADREYGFAVSGIATPDGKLYNPKTAPKRASTGKVYSSLFVRHWDEYITENRSTIFYGTLKKNLGGRYTLTSPGLTNASGSLESPVPPFGGAGDFDISRAGLAFVAKDPKINPATHTKSDLYYVPLDWSDERKTKIPQEVPTGNLQGYSASPVFSPDGKSVAFTRMKNIAYESDKPRLLLLPDIKDLANVQEFFQTNDGEGGWDLRPDAIIWSQDGKSLYVTAEDQGREKLFSLPASPRIAISLPSAITHGGAISSAQWLAKGDTRLFISSTSLIDNSIYSIYDFESDHGLKCISSNSRNGSAFGLSQDQVSDFWYKGSGDYKVHAWLIKPSNFDSTKKYPLAYLIHGGPQGAWTESWSTRWNPMVYAEAGYIVVTPNPTGSTGYGMDFQNAIKDNWGGRPYLDLVEGFYHIEHHFPFIDTSRAVALGASYGGYMINWIQGQPLGRKFKALVTHDGVFSTVNQYASEELFFPNHDFGGTIWENREGYEKWDPSRHTNNWKTPHLVIHNQLDYRLTMSEGLAAFNVLQSRGVSSRFLTFPDENHVSWFITLLLRSVFVREGR
jgi:dipeptidyl aminopeptidase/acylaminoacyl peptidase